MPDRIWDRTRVRRETGPAVLLSLFLDIIINPIILGLVGPPADPIALPVAGGEEAL